MKEAEARYVAHCIIQRQFSYGKLWKWKLFQSIFQHLFIVLIDKAAVSSVMAIIVPFQKLSRSKL